MARAASSFPVPVAPVINTEASVGATRPMTQNSFFITGDSPMRAGVLELAGFGLFSASRVVALAGERLSVWLVVQPSIAVGVARGINELTLVRQILKSSAWMEVSARDLTFGALLSKTGITKRLND